MAPARTGASAVLRWLGDALIAGVDDIEVTALLVDRPVEEQLEWRLELPAARIVGTSSDVDGPEEHAALVSTFHEAAHAAATGRHVALLVDSLAALARSLVATSDPRDTLAHEGGMAHATLRELRGLFGLARANATTDAGSLTILATVQTETHQQLDELLLHELVGTGNVEWRLDADAMQAGLFPPVDIIASSARRTELIVGDAQADRRARLRAQIDRNGVVGGLALLVQQLDELGTLDAVIDDLPAPPPPPADLDW